MLLYMVLICFVLLCGEGGGVESTGVRGKGEWRGGVCGGDGSSRIGFHEGLRVCCVHVCVVSAVGRCMVATGGESGVAL